MLRGMSNKTGRLLLKYIWKFSLFSLQPYIEQSIKEKERSANKVAVADEQNHVKDTADLENKQSSPDGDYHVILDPSDA